MNKNPIDILEEMIAAAEPCNREFQGNLLSEGTRLLTDQGWRRVEDVNFKLGSGLRGQRLHNPDTHMEAEIVAGNFLGSFTTLRFWHGQPMPGDEPFPPIPEGFQVVRRFPRNVILYRYRTQVSDDAGKHQEYSYEVWRGSERRRRFIYIDHKDQAEALARCWVDGYLTALSEAEKCSTVETT